MSGLLSVLLLDLARFKKPSNTCGKAVIALYTYLPCEVHNLNTVAWQRATCCVVNCGP